MAHGGTAGLGLLLLLLAAAPPQLGAMVIQRVFGANNTEIAFASAGGGTHMYLAGTGMYAGAGSSVCSHRPRALHMWPHGSHSCAPCNTCRPMRDRPSASKTG